MTNQPSRLQISSDAFPYETPLGHTYDSGDYEETLDTALERIDYKTLCERPMRSSLALCPVAVC